MGGLPVIEGAGGRRICTATQSSALHRLSTTLPFQFPTSKENKEIIIIQSGGSHHLQQCNCAI